MVVFAVMRDYSLGSTFRNFQVVFLHYRDTVNLSRGVAHLDMFFLFRAALHLFRRFVYSILYTLYVSSYTGAGRSNRSWDQCFRTV